MGVVRVLTSIEVQLGTAHLKNGKSLVAVRATCSTLCSEGAICASGAMWDKTYSIDVVPAEHYVQQLWGALDKTLGNSGCGAGSDLQEAMDPETLKACGAAAPREKNKREVREKCHLHDRRGSPTATTTTFASRNEGRNCCYQ